MKRIVTRLMVVGAMTLCFLKVAQAQSYYSDQYCEIGDASCDIIDTELTGHPFNGTGRCGSAEISSNLDGIINSASSVYPSTAKVAQSITGANDVDTYPWTYTEFFFPPTSTGCAVQRVTFNVFINKAITTYKIVTVNANGTATFTQACPGTSRASCGQANYLGREPALWAEET